MTNCKSIIPISEKVVAGEQPEGRKRGRPGSDPAVKVEAPKKKRKPKSPKTKKEPNGPTRKEPKKEKTLEKHMQAQR